MILNALRAHLAEFGITTAKGPQKVVELVQRLADPGELSLPEFARAALLSLAAQLETQAKEISQIERHMKTWHRQREISRRLETSPVLV